MTKPELAICILFFSICVSNVCAVFVALASSLTIGLHSFSEMRRLYWIKLKKNKNKNKHIEKGKRRVKKSSWKELLQIPGTFPGAFISDIVVQVIILVHSLKKESRING